MPRCCDDQLYDNQIPLFEIGKPGARLSDSRLMPHPFRCLEENPEGETSTFVHAWGRQLP
jgi:hypothetical protein